MKFTQGIYEYKNRWVLRCFDQVNREDLTRHIWDSIRETGLTFLGEASNKHGVVYITIWL
jgi:hypothetical protein